MVELIIAVIILLVAIYIIYNNSCEKHNEVEGFGGALVQLWANRGPQDAYLTQDYYPYGNLMLNNRYYYPYATPYAYLNNYLFPFESYSPNYWLQNYY